MRAEERLRNECQLEEHQDTPLIQDVAHVLRELDDMRDALQWALQYADFSVCDDSPLHRSALRDALKLAGMKRCGGLYD